jgi:hypothetical protein
VNGRTSTKLFLIGLALLLGVQLTGLSCLEEWVGLTLQRVPVLSNECQAGAMDISLVGDDGCPCHFEFMSGPRVAPESCHPISLLNIEAPATLGPGHISLPFHPPLVL